MLKALIVDDDIAVIQCFEKLIKWNELGYDRPFTAINGSEAYDIVVNNDISAIICDLKMPVMGGMEFARRLRENNINSEIILFSAYEDFSAACEGIELKVFDYLLKPLVLDTIKRLSDDLQKISVLNWINHFVNDKFDADILDAVLHGNSQYREEMFQKINLLEEMVRNEHICRRVLNKLTYLICSCLRELGFSEASIRYNHDRLAMQANGLSSYKEKIKLFYEKICNIMKTVNGFNISKTEDNIVMEIKRYIDRNCNCTVTDVSERFNYSADHISRIFRKSEGVTVTQYIAQIRMAQARHLIVETDMPMGEIAKKLGYNSLNYFTSSFRTFYGMPPTALRDRSKNLELYNYNGNGINLDG